MTAKEEVLGRAQQEYAAFRRAVAGLSEEQLTEPCVGSWGVREIAAHMAGWHREMMPALERLARGERPFAQGVSYDDADGWNAKFAAAVRHLPAADALRDLEGTHAAFLRAAAEVPEERFQPGKTAYRMVDLNSGHHYKEHGDEIRGWRTSRGM
jgi:uncharacterized protein (TIGR03083 family)